MNMIHYHMYHKLSQTQNRTKKSYNYKMERK